MTNLLKKLDQNEEKIFLANLSLEKKELMKETLKKRMIIAFQSDIEYKTVTPMTLQIIVEMTIERIFEMIEDESKELTKEDWKDIINALRCMGLNKQLLKKLESLK